MVLSANATKIKIIMKVVYKIYVKNLLEILDGSYESALVELSIENNEYNTEEEAVVALEDYMSWSTNLQGSEYTILKFYRK